MNFINFEDLVNKVNSSLGKFCRTFQYKRKELLKKGKASSPDKLFEVGGADRNWVINSGGGIELQYHMSMDDTELCYGLGFNAQYVPFANEKSPVNYIRPYVNSFLSNRALLTDLKSNGFDFVYGDETGLGNIQENDFILIGKEVTVTKHKANFSIADADFDQMIEDLKGLLYTTYVEVLSKLNINHAHMATIEDLKKVILNKKQLILQGPPGTGKTYTAKDLAESIIFNSVSPDKKDQQGYLSSSSQYKLVQFHPSYTYEDFVRGITTELGNGTLPEFVAKNKVFCEIAQDALDNFLDSEKDPTALSIDLWGKQKFEEFKIKIEEDLNNGNIKLTPKLNLIDIDDDCFRYTPRDPSKPGRRINFKEFLSLIIYNISNNTKDEITTSFKHAKFRKPYYKALLKIFFDFAGTYQSGTITKTELKPYVLIVDEINRANLPSVLGELIYGLEYRGEAVESMYAVDDDREIIIPPNLYIIGTMNTADRSVGHIDYAIKRRFAFENVLPDVNVISNAKAIDLYNKVSELFTEEFLASDFDKEDVQLGHSYFIVRDNKELKLKLRYEIVPILKEYIKDGLLKENAKDKLKEIKNFAI